MAVSCEERRACSPSRGRPVVKKGGSAFGDAREGIEDIGETGVGGSREGCHGVVQIRIDRALLEGRDRG